MQTVPITCELCDKQDIVEVDRVMDGKRLTLRCRSCGHSWSVYSQQTVDQRHSAADRRKASRTDRRQRP